MREFIFLCKKHMQLS